MTTKRVVLKLPAESPKARRRRAVSDSESDGEGGGDVSLSNDEVDVDEVDDDEEDDEDEDEDDEEDEEEEDEEEEEEPEEEIDDEMEDYAEEEGEFEMDSIDMSRLTARQRARIEDNDEGPPVFPDLTSIDMPSARKKKVLSVEEQRIKRAELARRRKNLSERRLEEEKQDTLDKLLKKRAGKTRKGESDDANSVSRSRLLPPHPAMTSWRSAQNSFTLSMTSERAAL